MGSAPHQGHLQGLNHLGKHHTQVVWDPAGPQHRPIPPHAGPTSGRHGNFAANSHVFREIFYLKKNIIFIFFLSVANIYGNSRHGGEGALPFCSSKARFLITALSLHHRGRVPISPRGRGPGREREGGTSLPPGTRRWPPHTPSPRLASPPSPAPGPAPGPAAPARRPSSRDPYSRDIGAPPSYLLAGSLAPSRSAAEGRRGAVRFGAALGARRSSVQSAALPSARR